MSDLRPRTGRWSDWHERLDNWEREYLEEYWQLKKMVKLASEEARRIRTRAASRSKFGYEPRIHPGELARLTDSRHPRTELAE